ncbi:MAG TPA: conjugal transfer protein TraC, partial [Candidatus Paceibacterota bacterium]|nr:conjugal transfer protein TraC [Candidatus Paceibacterota bacterium]
MLPLPFKRKEDKKKDILEPIMPQDIYEMGVLELKDIIAPSALRVTPKSISLGGKVIRTMYVISYPRFLSEEWFSPVINLDTVFDVSIFIHPLDTTTTLRSLQKKIAEVESQIQERAMKGMVRDPQLDTAQADIENLRDQLQQATEKIFAVGLYITIYADDDNELDKIENEIRSILDSKLVYLKTATYLQEDGFKSVVPFATDYLNVNYKMNSTPLSSLFPFISFDLTSNKGILFGRNLHNSSLVIF